MKKLAVIFAMLPLGVFAQKVTVGLKIGQGITHIQNTAVQDWYTSNGVTNSQNISLAGQTDSSEKFTYTEHNGFTGGLYANFEISEKFSFQPEAIFSGKGFNLFGNITRTVGDDFYQLEYQDVYRYNYIDVPLMARFNGKMGNLEPYFIVGPILSFNISSRVLHRETLLYSTSSEFNTQLQDNGFQVSGDDIWFINGTDVLDIGAVAGAGFDYNFGKHFTFKVEARYATGFLNAHQLDHPADGLEIKHKGLSFFMGIGIKIPKIEKKENTAEEPVSNPSF